ncbi:MAG TPA: ArsA family ATPase [Acidimicrobiales bacterium]|nr:ArsA family ATPase [Acidimicrobiales bacterium]
MPADLLDHKLLFVSGKGGVGKSTVAAALALLGSQRGKRTLACEIDAKGNLADFFEAGPTNYTPREVQPNLFAMSMDTEASLQEYLKLQMRLPAIARIGPLARAFEFVATAAPGVREILTVGKPVWEVREGNFDLVVVDAAATGHIVGQLAAPQAINDLVHVGLIRQQTSWLIDVLGNKETTGLVVVTTPEEMPVNETIELAARVEDETDVALSAIVVNRVLPELFGRQEEEVFEELRQPAAVAALDDATNGPVEPVMEGARLAVTMRRTRTGHIERLRTSVDPKIPLLYVPYLFMRAHGFRTTRQVADALSAELSY